MKLKPYLIKIDGKYKVEFRSKDPGGDSYVVSPSIDKDDYAYLVPAEIVVDTETGQTQWQAVVDEVARATGEADRIVEEQVLSLKKQYIKDVEQEMSDQFGTSDQIRGLFLYMTWMRMETHPEEYMAEGLVDDSGDPLDTETKVYDYARIKIMRAKDYSIFVLKKIAQLQSDIDAL